MSAAGSLSASRPYPLSDVSVVKRRLELGRIVEKVLHAIMRRNGGKRNEGNQSRLETNAYAPAGIPTCCGGCRMPGKLIFWWRHYAKRRGQRSGRHLGGNGVNTQWEYDSCIQG